MQQDSSDEIPAMRLQPSLTHYNLLYLFVLNHIELAEGYGPVQRHPCPRHTPDPQ